jgi:hypothetical protein
MAEKKTYFSFTYCTMHDTAFIVRGNYPYELPKHFQNNSIDCGTFSKKCEHCDWINTGIVAIDNKTINIVKRVETDYNKQYRGGFSFNIISDILDENGDELTIEDGSPFILWLKEIKTNTN